MDKLPLETTGSILRELDPGDLVSFGKATSFAYNVTKDFTGRAYSHFKILLPFLDTHENVKVFVDMMDRTGLVISGSQALAFFHRIEYPGSDLDLYVGSKTDGALVDDAVETLQGMGYRIVKTDAMSPFRRGYPNSVNQSSFTIHTDQYGESNLDRVIHMEKLGRVVQIIVPMVGVMDAILSFHSTVVMNFVTSTHAYCLYARATLVDKSTVHRYIVDSSRACKALDKYEERGFNILNADTSNPLLDIRYQIRRVGDKHCWTIPLSSGPQRVRKQWPSIERNTWKLVCDFSAPTQSAVHFHYATYKSPTHCLCIADDILVEMTEGPEEWTDETILGYIADADVNEVDGPTDIRVF